MGVQTYIPRDHQDILQVENATSRRRADCGTDIQPFGGRGVSTIWLEDDGSSAAIMADWPWESANASSSDQQASPLVQGSPLQSSSSQSSHEAMQRTSQEFMQPPLDALGLGVRTTSSRTSLVETLQTCLTSLPSPTNAPALASPTGGSLSDPSGASTPTLQQSRSAGALSGSTSKALGPAKPTKRRSRASRRVPTTVLEATSSDFRDMVQRLTGVSAANSAAPVRPQPQRAAPTTFIRPDRPLPSATVIRPAANSSMLNLSTPTTSLESNVASFDDIFHILQRSSSELFAPLHSSNIKREFHQAESSVQPFSMSGSIMATRPLLTPSNTTWTWESAAHEQSRHFEFPNASSSLAFANEIIGASGEANVSSTSGLIVLPDDNDLSSSPFDISWLPGHDEH
ncbi:hypothetical protein KC19_3G025500 [Ceratodon purpureus]|uniref:VQ domain-containing protein n=1 Tax=Ceratodon purpureus TaxID=3225 RepID=A0A8T0IG50_CERPU|nr:hypothetical protein KC19_3G025500 [Ceratodon purpureus]